MTKPVSVIAFQTPDEAEAAFYKAFEQGDLEAMMAVWMDGEIVCIHPMGTLLTGTQAVRSGWQQLFTDFSSMHFQNETQLQTRTHDLSIHVVIENIYLQGDTSPRPPILATNIYRKTDSGWRMFEHHASPSVINPAPGQAPGIPDPLLH